MRQRKYHSHKSHQMSELRLRIEKERMDRWERLKSRIHTVQQRREQRMTELQRRNAAGSSDSNLSTIPLSKEITVWKPEPLSPTGESNISGEAEQVRGGKGEGKRRKKKNKKNYSSLMNHVLLNLHKFKMTTDEAAEKSLFSFTIPALEVLKALYNKKGVADMRERMQNFYFCCLGKCKETVNDEEDESEKWIMQLDNAFKALLASSDRESQVIFSHI